MRGSAQPSSREELGCTFAGGCAPRSWRPGAPLPIRGGGQIAPCTIDGIDYEQCTVAQQELLDASGNIVATHPAGVALFHPEHNYWHQSAVAESKIMRGDPVTGTQVAKGTKITFCFVDVEFIGLTGSQKKAQPRTYFECNGDLQGLASGWADSYHQSSPLQELDITGLAEGELEHSPCVVPAQCGFGGNP